MLWMQLSATLAALGTSEFLSLLMAELATHYSAIFYVRTKSMNKGHLQHFSEMFTRSKCPLTTSRISIWVQCLVCDSWWWAPLTYLLKGLGSCRNGLQTFHEQQLSKSYKLSRSCTETTTNCIFRCKSNRISNARVHKCFCLWPLLHDAYWLFLRCPE